MYKHNSFRSYSRRGYNRPRHYGRFNRFSNHLPNRNTIDLYIKKASVKKSEILEIKVTESRMQVDKLSIHDELKKNIINRGYTHLMPIQERGIPVIIEGKDVIGIANTGTGKTAAFLIPIIEHIINDSTYKALIITPTRELALQIRDEFRKFTNRIQAFSTFCIGQSSIRNQIYEIKRNPHLIVGTPGRLKDLIERRVLKLSEFRMVVLDEVDRMLDMGFINDVKKIISYLPEKRQSLFFSATVSPEIDKLIQSFVVNPVTISVKTQETISDIHQDVVYLKNGETKIETLQKLLQNEEAKKVLVFSRTKMGVERISRELFQKGFKVASIHGDKPQFKRQQAIRLFKENAVEILIATDVASRGLDISNITHVVNYDIPATYEDYIHRIGRTGRANQKGTALTFVEE